MKKIENHEVVPYLMKLKEIYKTVGSKDLGNDVKKLERMILFFSSPKKTDETPKKRSYKDSLTLILDGNYDQLSGTKLNYSNLSNEVLIIDFIESNSKSKVIKETTALDLKLLYSLLTGDSTDIKGNKNQVYETIKRNIRARKRGEAFTKMINN